MTVQLNPAMRNASAYESQRFSAPCDLDLARTDLPPLLPEAMLNAAKIAAAGANGYPDASSLTRQVAATIGVDPSRVLITAGADDALARAFRAALAPGSEAVLTTPTFEMLPRFAQLAGATCREVQWINEPLPVAELLDQVNEATRLICVVTPNNPTGSVATADDLRRLALAAPKVMIVIDLAYADFADADPTTALCDLPNVVITRTFSKIYGLAAWRVGYAVASTELIGSLRRAGLPYPVSGTSLAVASATLRAAAASAAVRRRQISRQRARLTEALSKLGTSPIPSQGNFVAITGPRAAWTADALASLGIGTRTLTTLDGALTRITCPEASPVLDRLIDSLTTALAPEAVLFDMDGVLANVSASYQEAIIQTAAAFGATVTNDDISARKARGNANDDWVITWDLLRDRGLTPSLSEVTERFEELYQGTDAAPGLRSTESLVPGVEWLRALAARLPLAVVTGRPRSDAEYFLEIKGIRSLFSAVITRDDGPLKPDPAPVRAALAALGVRRAWMVGDTPDDIRAARRAGVIPFGIVAPGDASTPVSESLMRAGAARVISPIEELSACLC